MSVIFYYPSSQAEQVEWCKNMMDNLGTEGPKIDEKAEDIASVQADCKGIIDINKQVEDARNALHNLLAARDEYEAAAGKRIRDYVKRLKLNPKYTTAIGTILRVISTVYTEDLATITVKLKAVLSGRHVEIRLGRIRTKHAVNLYCRIGGTGEFTLLSTVTQSPYLDERPAATAGKSELREYYGMPVVNNKEVGVASAIVSVTFKG